MSRSSVITLFLAMLCSTLACKKKNNSPVSFTYTGTQQVYYPITFRPNITNASSYKWDFGDGATSTDATPTHIYTTAAAFTVSLVLNNNTAEPISKTISIGFATIPAGSAIDFTFKGVPTAGHTLSFSSNAGGTYLWSFGDGSTSTDASPTHVYTMNDTFDVSLVINGDISHLIKKKINISAGGIYLSLIPTGPISWRHIYSEQNNLAHTFTTDTLANAVMTVNFVPPYLVVIGSDTLTYYEDPLDSALTFFGAYRALHTVNKLVFTPGGINMFYHVNDYFSVTGYQDDYYYYP